MVSVVLECGAGEKDELVAELWERGTQGIVEGELPDGRTELRAFFKSSIDDQAWTRFKPRWREEADQDWSEQWRDSWQPQLVGERFFLTPSWSDAATPPGRVRIEMPTGMAFGTGQHATTQLCLEAMERYLNAGETVLDLGTGSGILARAAVILQAGRVIGCDIDVEAAVAAVRYAEGASVFAGSLRSVRSGSVDLLVANINAETIVSLAGEIKRTSRRAILTGFPPQEAARVERALGRAMASSEKDGWAALIWNNES